MSAVPRSYNPFAEEDEEEEEVAARGSGERQRYLQQEVLRRSAATADSTARSLSLLYESERIGVAASEVGRGGSGPGPGAEPPPFAPLLCLGRGGHPCPVSAAPARDRRGAACPSPRVSGTAPQGQSVPRRHRIFPRRRRLAVSGEAVGFLRKSPPLAPLCLYGPESRTGLCFQLLLTILIKSY